MLEAVIFDFDGVIFNSPHYIYITIKNHFKKFNINFTKSDFKDHLARVTSDFITIMNKKYKLNLTVEGFGKEVRSEFLKLLEDNYNPNPGILKLLKTLKKNNIKIGIASSNEKDIIKYKLKKLNLVKYFDIIVSKEDVKRYKPFPDSVLFACKKLKVNPNNSVGIEDAPMGVIGINDAGLKSIGLITEFTKKADFKKVNTDLIVKSLEELNFLKIKKLILK